MTPIFGYNAPICVLITSHISPTVRFIALFGNHLLHLGAFLSHDALIITQAPVGSM